MEFKHVDNPATTFFTRELAIRNSASATDINFGLPASGFSEKQIFGVSMKVNLGTLYEGIRFHNQDSSPLFEKTWVDGSARDWGPEQRVEDDEFVVGLQAITV